MTSEEMRAYLQMLGFQDYGVPIGTDSNSQLNLFQDVMNTMSDPTFLYLQNLISGEQLATDVQDLLYDSIDPSEADWASMESTAEETGNDLLVQAMRDIRAGLTSNQVKTKLMKQFAVNNMVNDVDKNTIDNLIADLEDYEKKYKRAVEIDSKLLAGQYIQDEFGNILSPVDQETGRKRLEGAGFEGYYANPQNWQTAPNKEDVAKSQKFLEEANALEEERLNKSKAITKSSATTAESAYKSFLSKTPEGRQVLERVSAPRKQQKKDDSQARNIALGLIANTIGLPVALGYTGWKAANAVVDSIGKSTPGTRDAQGNFIRPWDRKPIAVQKREQEKAQTNQDYWAKLAASYAGRGEQEQKSKEVAALGKRVEQKKQAAQASMDAARTIQRGTTPALDMLAIAPYFAAMASRSVPKAKTGKPAMRTLSDQEIETMSNMIAGGLA
jgi:hypothetical protein